MHACDSFVILKCERKVKMKTRSGKKLKESSSELRVKKNSVNQSLQFSSKQSIKNPSNDIINLNKSPTKMKSLCIRIEKLDLSQFNQGLSKITGIAEIDANTTNEQKGTTTEVSNESSTSSTSIKSRKPLKRLAKQQTKDELNQTSNFNSNEGLPHKTKPIALKKNEKANVLKVVEVGQNVLAKQRYSVPWPAKVLAIRSKAVDVYFYGDGRTGPVKRDDLFSIPNSRHVILECLRKKIPNYMKGIIELERVSNVPDRMSIINFI